MNINDAQSLYAELILGVAGKLNEWRIEQALSGNKTNILPSFLCRANYASLASKSFCNQRIMGINALDREFIHSMVIWTLGGKTVRMPNDVLRFALDSKQGDAFDISILMQLPAQAMHIDVKFDGFSGLLVNKDYALVNNKKIFFISLCLLDETNVNGLSFIIPLKADTQKSASDEPDNVKETEKRAISLLVYILNQYKNREDIAALDGVDHIGLKLKERFSKTIGKDGYWRSAHWNTYWTKDENGVESSTVKWIEPVWVPRA